MLKVKEFTFNPLQENTYVIYDQQGWCAIIDPGCYFEDERAELQDFIKENGLQPKYLLNTHCHLDHIFGNQFVHQTWGLSLWMHPNEDPLLDAAPAMAAQWGLPFEPYSGPRNYLQNGDRVKLGVVDLLVLLLPGHSPGSIGFYCADQQWLISGDVLFREGIGRSDLPGGDAATLLRSIREGLWPLPDAVQVFPGHGPATSIGYEKQHNPFVGLRAG